MSASDLLEIASTSLNRSNTEVVSFDTFSKTKVKAVSKPTIRSSFKAAGKHIAKPDPRASVKAISKLKNKATTTADPPTPTLKSLWNLLARGSYRLSRDDFLQRFDESSSKSERFLRALKDAAANAIPFDMLLSQAEKARQQRKSSKRKGRGMKSEWTVSDIVSARNALMDDAGHGIHNVNEDSTEDEQNDDDTVADDERDNDDTPTPDEEVTQVAPPSQHVGIFLDGEYEQAADTSEDDHQMLELSAPETQAMQATQPAREHLPATSVSSLSGKPLSRPVSHPDAPSLSPRPSRRQFRPESNLPPHPSGQRKIVPASRRSLEQVDMEGPLEGNEPTHLPWSSSVNPLSPESLLDNYVEGLHQALALMRDAQTIAQDLRLSLQVLTSSLATSEQASIDAANQLLAQLQRTEAQHRQNYANHPEILQDLMAPVMANRIKAIRLREEATTNLQEMEEERLITEAELDIANSDELTATEHARQVRYTMRKLIEKMQAELAAADDEFPQLRVGIGNGSCGPLY